MFTSTPRIYKNLSSLYYLKRLKTILYNFQTFFPKILLSSRSNWYIPFEEVCFKFSCIILRKCLGPFIFKHNAIVFNIFGSQVSFEFNIRCQLHKNSARLLSRSQLEIVLHFYKKLTCLYFHTKRSFYDIFFCIANYSMLTIKIMRFSE